MNYIQFRNKWLGKGIDYDNSYGFQCVDVYRMYVKEVLECLQSPSVKGAVNIWTTYLTEFFDKIEKKSDNYPQQGDVVIWNIGTYGHIAICDHADVNSLTCFEQNWSEGGTSKDGTGVSELRVHNYTKILGWLRPKKSTNGVIITTMEQLPKDNVLKDIRTALCGVYSEDEIKADLASGKNLVEIITSICKSDEKFRVKWIPTIESSQTAQNQPGSVENENTTVDTSPVETPISPSFLTELKNWIKSLFS